jgi:Icc-related predicted phosphoesterase
MSNLRILTIGDSHGRKPILAKKLIKKYNPDILVCTGDLAYSEKVRKEIFSHWKELNEEDKTLSDIIGKKKNTQIQTEAAKSMNAILNYMNSLGKPIYLIYGNNDYPRKEIKNLGLKAKGIEDLVKKYENINLMLSSKSKMDDYNLLGVSGYRRTNSIAKSKIGKDSHGKKFKKLLKNLKGNSIVLYHDVPFGTKLDLVRNKVSPMNGKHVGSKVMRSVIKKYSPLLYICGHMHENPGVIKLYKTICLNTGSIQNQDYYIININDNKVAISRVK